MNGAVILAVDDEFQIRRTLRVALSSNGYEVIDANNGQEAIETLMRERPDLILLDVNIPDMTGLEACREIRRSFEGPIIMLTVRDSERDKIEAFNSGADDYIVKPFAMGELLARIRAALKHSKFGKPLPKIETQELYVNLENRIVNVRGGRVHMTPKEFEVLRVLVIHQGKAVAYRKILQAVWGPDYGEETEKLRTVIGQIRKKIEQDPARPRYIATEPWFGYRFEIPVKNARNHPPKS